MRILDFSGGRTPASPLLEGVTVAPLTQGASEETPFQAAVFRIAPGGRIARHAGPGPQILAVVEGSVRANGEVVDAGHAVFWAAGEEHETTSEAGATAVVIEGKGIEPFSSAAATA